MKCFLDIQIDRCKNLCHAAARVRFVVETALWIATYGKLLLDCGLDRGFFMGNIEYIVGTGAAVLTRADVHNRQPEIRCLLNTRRRVAHKHTSALGKRDKLLG